MPEIENRGNTKVKAKSWRLVVGPVPIAATVATLLVFALIVAAVSLKLRAQVRNQIVARDAEVLYPVALMEISRAEDDFLSDPLLQMETDLLEVVLSTSELKGVIAVRIFEPDGKFSAAVPEDFLLGSLSPAVLQKIGQREPVSRYHPQGNIENYFIDVKESSGDAGYPLLEVVAPLHRTKSSELLGIAQYLLDGQEIAAEFTSLDANLGRQAGVAFAAGSFLIILVFLWAFGRVGKAYKEIEERGQRLLAANAELAMMAKTSAIGAVASHLVHGLKNPLSGLQDFISGGNEKSVNIDHEDWQLAIESTRRMQDMIREIVGILQEEKSASGYDYTLAEIRSLVVSKAKPAAQKSGVIFSAGGETPEARLDSRQGNLLMLILMNLVQNAVEATPEGKEILFTMEADEEKLFLRVADAGPGIPHNMLENLFSPCKSSKPGGSGLGLAISRQLAKHMGGELSLEKNGTGGACFLLTLDKTADNWTPTPNHL